MSRIQKLTSPADLDRLWLASHEAPVFLLKHSLICGVSMVALEQYQAFAESAEGKVEITLLEIQPHRDLSAAVAERSGVRHQSPQALLVRNGTVEWSKTHYSITTESLSRAMDSIQTPSVEVSAV